MNAGVIPAISLLLLSCGGTESLPVRTQIAPMHYSVLYDTPWQWGEESNAAKFTVTTTAHHGDMEILLQDASNLKSKLIAYTGAGKYYSNVIEAVNGNAIRLRFPLKADIAAGENVYRFYRNEAHPDTQGYYAIADHAVDTVGNDKNRGTHVLFGDSWAGPEIRDRLQIRLPDAHVVSAGVGGDDAQRLIDRFDRDVVPLKPDFVWVMVGTNDVYENTGIATFIDRLKVIDGKIRKIGATPIIFDVSVCPDSYPGRDYNLHELSNSYADSIWTTF